MKYQILDIKSAIGKNPEMGGLSFVEAGRDIPFPIARVYWIYNVNAGQHRGFHAHKRNWQLLFCPYGSIDIILTDGRERETIRLDSPSKGLVLTPGLWREMIWLQDDSVLCVAASEFYDENEYIRNYDEYIKYVAERNEKEN